MGQTQNLAFDIGETWVIKLICHDENGVLLDLTGASAALMIATPTPLNINLANGAAIPAPSSGEVIFSVEPHLQAALVGGPYSFTCRITGRDGLVSDQAFGTIWLRSTEFGEPT